MIKVKLALSGFHLMAGDFNLKNCNSSEEELDKKVNFDFFDNMNILLNLKEGKIKLDELSVHCLKRFLPTTKAIIDYLGKREGNKIPAKFKRLEKAVSTNFLNDFFLLIKKAEDRTVTPYLDLEKSKIMLKQTKNEMIGLIMELALSLDTKNTSWAKKTVKKILLINPFLLIEYPFSDLSAKEEGLFVDYLERIFRVYQKKTKDELGTQMLANHFNFLSDSKGYRLLVNRFNADWSLHEARSIIKTNIFSKVFFDFWYIYLVNRTSDNDVRNAMRSLLDKRALSRMNFSQLWLFKHYLPGDASLREVIVEKMIFAWKRGSPLEKVIVLESIDNEILKREVSKLLPEFKKPLYQIRRSFYKKLLERWELYNFSFYQLALLGDRNEENLWLLVL